MRLKKHIARAMAVAMVFSLTAVTAPAMKAIPVMAADGDGSETSTKKIKVDVDYAGYAATISSENGDKYFFVEVLKDKEGKKVANTYCYSAPDSEISLDLSFLKADKEQYIRVYGDVTTDKTDVQIISARPSKLKIKFTPQYKNGAVDLYSSFEVSVGGSTVTLNAENADQYLSRGLYASPMYVEGLSFLADGKLEQLMVSGTTLLVSKDAVEANAEKKTDGAPASAEVKVKISAIPKAPKVTTDYVKGVVKFAKNAQIRLVYLAAKDATETTEQTEWKDLSSTSLTPEDILKAAGVTNADVIAYNIQKGFKIIVRTKADGKKAASALTFVNVDGQLQAAQTKNSDDSLKNEITVQVDKDTTAKLTWTATETGVTFKAEKADFQYVENGKTKKLAKDKEVKVKFTGKKTFTVSLAGLKSTKTTTGYFASNTVNIEVEQVYPAAKTPTAKTEGNKVTVTSGDLELVFERTSDTAVTVSGDTSKFERKDGESYAALSNSMTVTAGAQTITVRVAKGEKNAASEAATVTIPAYTAPAQ